MKLKELLSVLQEQNKKELLFEYSKNQFAGTNYHLTEVKNVTFETVDCGGKVNDWKETHLQLWESPTEVGKENYITAEKAVTILERVNNIRPLWLETEVKVEFGNADFHMSILSIDRITSDANKVIVKLFTNETGCKAEEACCILEEDVAASAKLEETCCSNSDCC